MSALWKERQRPVRLERRYEFADYEQLRDFLDAAAELSETEGLWPDMGFGKDYVNVTLHLEPDQETLSDAQRQFAQALDQLLPTSSGG